MQFELGVVCITCVC